MRPRRPRDGPTGRRRRGSRSIGRRSRCLPRRCRPPARAATARRSSTNPVAPPRWGRRARNALRPNSGRRSRSGAARRRRTGSAKHSRARSRRSSGGSGSNVRASVNPSRMPGPSSPGLTSNVMNTGPSSESASPDCPFGPPERRLVGGVGLAQVALRPVLARARRTRRAARGRSRWRRGVRAGWRRRRPRGASPPRRRRVHDGAVGARARCVRPPRSSRTRSPSSSAIRSAICWVPAGKRSCCAPPSTSSMGPMPPAALT